MSPSSPTPSSSDSQLLPPSPPSLPGLTIAYLINHLDTFDSPDPMQSPADIISGNAPASIKEAAVRWFMILDGGGIATTSSGRRIMETFGQSMRRRIEILDVSLEQSVDDPLSMCMKMVCELEVTPDMCDINGFLSNGCMTCLMDEGSAIALLLFRFHTEDDTERIGVSQTFNFFFHHPPPPLGSRIRIVSRSISAQKEIGCCHCEIWDTENHRLIISGQQLQMQPSIPQSKL